MSDKITMDDQDKITTSIPILQLTASSFKWITVEKWNRLPDAIRAETSLTRFKSALKRHIKDRRTQGTDDHDPD